LGSDASSAISGSVQSAVMYNATKHFSDATVPAVLRHHGLQYCETPVSDENAGSSSCCEALAEVDTAIIIAEMDAAG
jgi:hypothetical protein